MAEQQRFGNEGLQIARDVFAAWDSYQADGDRARLQAQIAPLQGKLHALLEHATRKSPRTKYHRVFAKSLLKRWPALWTFTHTDGVEPTNNHAERGLRGAGRGRDRRCWRPPAQIPACAFNAPGSCLGFWRRSVRLARGAGCGVGVAIGRRGGASASRSCWFSGCDAGAHAASVA